MSRLIGGLIQFKVDGQMFQAKGEFTYNVNMFKKEMVAGSDSVHGYKELPQVPYIEGAITDSVDLKIKDLFAIAGATVTLELANGKTIVLEEACYAGDGEGSTEEGEIEVRFEGVRGREVS